MKNLICLFSLACVILCAGCGSRQQQYEWCDYSESCYAMAKNDCEETQVRHKAELERIVEVAAKKNLSVPPGIYAEYGFLLFKSGKPKDALGWYEKERQLYPESGVFMDMLSKVAQRQIDRDAAKPEDGKADEGQQIAPPVTDAQPHADEAAPAGGTDTDAPAATSPADTAETPQEAQQG
ncbi:DUF4810 domain-containing protein [Desulfovibrio psychrotolerans]|uniref:Lipoprotein n=1 Tax=Desulfovibrio psychrotolerans TaxID=415242 RepID=A0A7J0BX34_9BACT|nr:DUF4810 domain-containing protein [Desulfovibrio psychrotolerans]GFM38270.1 hypothetical protein DSM19430T_29540 [Desulfovibrio psychrotolerans]